jgi:hypothetical protein
VNREARREEGKRIRNTRKAYVVTQKQDTNSTQFLKEKEKKVKNTDDGEGERE